VFERTHRRQTDEEDERRDERTLEARGGLTSKVNVWNEVEEKSLTRGARLGLGGLAESGSEYLPG
jgi:hypothetical protein